MGVVRLCWCFGVLLVLVPALNARNVKLIPAGTKTITTDGATHEISRYIFVPDVESNDSNADNEKILQVIRNTTKNDDANIHFEDSKMNTLKNQSANVYNVQHTKTRTVKHKNIITAKAPDVVKYNVVLTDNNYKDNHENNVKISKSLIKAENDAQVNAENTKFAIKVIPLHQESKSNVYLNGYEGGEKIRLRKHLDQSNDVLKLHHHETGQSLSAGSTENTVLDLNIDKDYSEADISSSENSAGDSWHVKTKTKYKPTKITNIRIAGLPIKWDTESSDETGNHSLHASIGINKTFTLPGKRGRFKLIYEDVDYNDENAVLERPILHTRTSQYQNRTRLNVNEKLDKTIKISGDTETNKERLLFLKIKSNNQDRVTKPVQKDTNLDTHTKNENGYVERLSLKTSNTNVSPQRDNIKITETNYGYPKLEVIESHSGSLAKHEDKRTSTLLSNTNISVDRKPNLQMNTEISKSETKNTKKELTLSDTNEVNKTFTKTTRPIQSSNQSAEIISNVIEEVEPNIKLTKSFMQIENHTEVIPPNKYVVFSNGKVTSESVIKNSKTASLVNDKIDIENENIQPETKSLTHSIKTVNTRVPSTIIKVSSFENQGHDAKAIPETVSINIISNSGEAHTKTSIVPNDYPNVDIVKTVPTVTKSNVNESIIADDEIVQTPGSLNITGSKKNVRISGSPKERDPNLLIDFNVSVPKTENYFLAGKPTQNDNQIEIDSEEHSKTKTTAKSENLGEMLRYSQINKNLNQTRKIPRPLHEIAKPSEVIKFLYNTEKSNILTKNNITVEPNTDIAEPTIQSVSNSAEFSTRSKSENNEIINIDLSKGHSNTILYLPQNKIMPLEDTIISTYLLPNATTKSDEINVLKKETNKLVHDQFNFINNTNPTNKISLFQNLMPDISNNSNANVKLERHNTKVLPTIERINVQDETHLKHKASPVKNTTLVDDHDNLSNNMDTTKEMSLPLNLITESKNTNKTIKLGKHNTGELPPKVKNSTSGKEKTEKRAIMPSHVKSKTKILEYDHNVKEINPTDKMILPLDLVLESNNIDVNDKIEEQNTNVPPTKEIHQTPDQTENSNKVLPVKETKTLEDDYNYFGNMNPTNTIISPFDPLPESNNIDVNDKMEEQNTNVPPTKEIILTADQTETSNEMLPLKETKTLEDDYIYFGNINPTNTMISPLDPIPESNNIDVNVKLGNQDSNVLPMKISSPGETNTMSFKPLGDISEAVIMASNEENNEGHELEVFPQLSTNNDPKEYPFKKDDSGSSRIKYREEYSDSQPANPNIMNLASKNNNDDSSRNRYYYRYDDNNFPGREYPVHTYSYRQNYPNQALNGYATQSNDPNLNGIDDEYIKHILHHLLSSNNQQYVAAGQETDPSAIRLASIIRYLQTLGIKLSPEQFQFLTQQIHQQKTVKKWNHNVMPLMVNQIIIPSQNVYILPYSNSYTGATEKPNRIHNDNVNTNNNIAYLSNRVFNIATYLKTIGISDAVINQYIAEVKQYLTPEFIRPVVTECQKRTYASLGERIDVIAAQVLQRSNLSKPRSYHHQYTSPQYYYQH